MERVGLVFSTWDLRFLFRAAVLEAFGGGNTLVAPKAPSHRTFHDYRSPQS